MFDQFLDWFDFTASGVKYNLFKTPWEYFINNLNRVYTAIASYTSNNPSQYQYADRSIYGLVVVSALGIAFMALIIYLFVRIFSSIARSFYGFLRFK